MYLSFSNELLLLIFSEPKLLLLRFLSAINSMRATLQLLKESCSKLEPLGKSWGILHQPNNKAQEDHDVSSPRKLSISCIFTQKHFQLLLDAPIYMRMSRNSRLQNQRKRERSRHTIVPLPEKVSWSLQHSIYLISLWDPRTQCRKLF